MGTTTVYLRNNDIGRKLSSLTKEELEELGDRSPYKDDNHSLGWHVPLELHNGNVQILVFWKGRLMRLDQAPKELNRKYYDKYTGKTRKEYEWTILKKSVLNELNGLDKDFKKSLKILKTDRNSTSQLNDKS
ncbi:MAG: hypothetical protein AABX12_03060 [Nanoarchaeota archaeon]